jgi:leucine-rich repeat protein SHOC2
LALSKSYAYSIYQGIIYLILGADFAQLTSLQWLDLSRNQLTAFPAQLGSLTGLKFINLNRNRISVVSDGLGKLNVLDSLFLDGDFFNKADKKIQSLPADICSLKNLKKLTLKDNIIERLPDCMGDLSSLIWLYLRGNVVSQLPASFVKLSKLQTLDLKQIICKACQPGLRSYIPLLISI